MAEHSQFVLGSDAHRVPLVSVFVPPTRVWTCSVVDADEPDFFAENWTHPSRKASSVDVNVRDGGAGGGKCPRLDVDGVVGGPFEVAVVVVPKLEPELDGVAVENVSERASEQKGKAHMVLDVLAASAMSRTLRMRRGFLPARFACTSCANS